MYLFFYFFMHLFYLMLGKRFMSMKEVTTNIRIGNQTFGDSKYGATLVVDKLFYKIALSAALTAAIVIYGAVIDPLNTHVVFFVAFLTVWVAYPLKNAMNNSKNIEELAKNYPDTMLNLVSVGFLLFAFIFGKWVYDVTYSYYAGYIPYAILQAYAFIEFIYWLGWLGLSRPAIFREVETGNEANNKNKIIQKFEKTGAHRLWYGFLLVGAFIAIREHTGDAIILLALYFYYLAKTQNAAQI